MGFFLADNMRVSRTRLQQSLGALSPLAGAPASSLKTAMPEIVPHRIRYGSADRPKYHQPCQESQLTQHSSGNWRPSAEAWVWG